MAVAVRVPERSVAQRLDALKRANEVRCYRARLKKEAAAGRVDVPALIADNDNPLLFSMQVQELLIAQRGWGRGKVTRLLRSCAVSPSKTLDGLTQRQRLDIVRGLYGQPPAR